jgi:hypothetical protein
MTETTPTGPPESAGPTPPTSQQRLDETDRLLDEYERTLGLPAAFDKEVEREATRLLNLSPSVLRKMSAQECGEAAFTLRQFSRHLQRSVNREQARVAWCEENIDAIIAKEVHKYAGASFVERKLKAVRENEAAAKIDRLRVHAKLRVERVSFLAAKVGDEAEALKSLQFTKRGEDK